MCAVLVLDVSQPADVLVSERFAAHVERVEGFRARAYKDIAGHWTIGFGHLIKPYEVDLIDKTLTRDDALALLRKDVQEAEDAVNDLVLVPLRQEQYDALVSFVFNIGRGAFARSTLLAKLNRGHCCAVPDEMRRWTKQPALRARREAEVALYVGDLYGKL